VLGVVAGLLVSGCGDARAPGTVDPEDVEIALYVAIQDGTVRAERDAEDAGRPPLPELFGITCTQAAFEGWACSVELSDGSRVACTVDRAERVGRETVLRGSVRCTY
jgi:hypothetical protein